MRTDKKYMTSEINNAEFEVVKIMQNHLSKRGFRVSQRKLMDTIFEFLAKNEKEILHRMEEKKNYDLNLKKWLENPIETERTNALEEHDLVV